MSLLAISSAYREFHEANVTSLLTWNIVGLNDLKALVLADENALSMTTTLAVFALHQTTLDS